jgi:hypothetical protein
MKALANLTLQKPIVESACVGIIVRGIGSGSSRSAASGSLNAPFGPAAYFAMVSGSPVACSRI